ncbi:MAG: hypothetical protein WDA24_06720 [Tissierellales bacterium]
MANYHMGIDTSAYTTSIAIVDEFHNVIFDERILLKVKEGNRGLRQQEAVFQHINNLPEIINSLSNIIDMSSIKTVSASVRPRNLEDSYMPVFKVAQGQAFLISKILKAEYKEFSHQDGHIASGVLGSHLSSKGSFLACHMSGGTTEMLLVKDNTKNYDIKHIGGTKDISAGQLIDRIGVKLGFKFPCGKEMDIFSQKGIVVNKRLPVNTERTWINFSGAETFFYNLVEEKIYSKEDISKSVFRCIANALANVVIEVTKVYDINDVLIVGGVAANTLIRNIITEKANESKPVNIYFPVADYCTDNAIGIALLGATKSGEKSLGGL